MFFARARSLVTTHAATDPRGAGLAAARHTATSLCAALVVGGFTFAYRYLSFERFPNDHFVHLSRAQQILMGALPVRDYSEYQAPLAAMASAGAQLLFGPGLRSELWLVCGVFAVASAVACLVAEVVSGSIGAGIASALILTAATPVSYSYPKILPYVLAMGAAWLYACKPDGIRLWLLAASVVFAGLLRHDHAIILGAGAGVAVLATHGSSRARATALLHLAVAGLVLAAPYIVWVHRYEGVGNYIASNLDVGRIEASKATWAPARFELDRTRPSWVRMADLQEPVVYVRWQPNLSVEARSHAETAHGLHLLGDIEHDAGQYEMRSTSAGAVEDLLKDAAVKETAGINRRTSRLEDRRPPSARVLQYFVLPGDGLRPALVALLYYLSWLLPVMAAPLLVARWTHLAAPVRALASMAIVVQLVLCREMLRDPLATRVRDVAAPLVILLAVLTVLTRVNAFAEGIDAWIRRVGLVVLFVGVGAAAAGAGSFGPNLRETGIPRGWNGLVARAAEIRERYAPPRERTGVEPAGLVRYVIECTAPHARIFALTYVSELFFYSGRGFAGGYDALHSRFYSSDRQATQILQRLSHEDVPLVILDNETESSVMQTYPRIAAYVRQRYHEAGRIGVGQGKEYIVLAENVRMPVRTFMPENLPCYVPAQHPQLSLAR